MSGAAQKIEPLEELEYQQDSVENGGGSRAQELRRVASERLEAHRRRRAQAAAQEQALEAEAAERQARMKSGSSRVRDAVAARYQQSLSYREFLAQEAERALQQAQAEADVAARKAQAVAEAQMALLEEIEQWKEADAAIPTPREAAMAQQAAETRDELAHELADIALAATKAMHLQPRIEMAPASEPTASGLTVRLYEEIAPKRNDKARDNAYVPNGEEHEASALDDEIAFRIAPEFQEIVAEPVVASANVIEFPRQLVATVKARPRREEGPLRAEAPAEPQLRIFEVEPEQISIEPIEPSSAPQWQGMMLDAAMMEDVLPVETHLQFTMQPQAAAMGQRCMAVIVDGCCVLMAFVGFVAVIAKIAGEALHNLPNAQLGMIAAATLGVFYLLYQMLFFTLSEATPGMRYARIALCTFSDQNPTRAAMRRRVLATILAACPMGLGLAWSWMDDDKLGWHDRMSRMYQRGY